MYIACNAEEKLYIQLTHVDGDCKQTNHACALDYLIKLM